MKKKTSSPAKYFLLAVPMLLGITGYFAIDGRPFLQSVYISTKLYGFGAEELPPNTIIELARWIGPVATASGFVMLVRYLRRSFLNMFAYLKGNSTAVYGPEEAKEPILEQLGGKGIDGRDKFIKAHRYILLDREEENLTFFDKYRDEIGDNDVYAACNSLSAQSVAYHNLHLFCPEETAASVFWKEHCIYPLSKAKGHHLDIVFIGFEKLGKEVLLSALQSNIFSPQQCINYHIFGKDEGFCNIYHQLDNIDDKVFFHSEEWHTRLEFINSADMVIVLQQNSQPQLMRQLTLACSCEKIHFFTAADYSTNLLENSSRLVPFNWKKVASTIDNILEISLFSDAKKLNLRYAHLYNGVEETPENAEKEWQKLNTFTRYSNISAIDYNDIQKLMLKEENQGTVYNEISPEWREKLAELEHIRWCRYHYINNWKYGKPEQGLKDKEKRIHADLLPYYTLEKSEQDKDRENVRILFAP